MHGRDVDPLGQLIYCGLMSGVLVLCVDDDAIITATLRKELKRSVEDAVIETAPSGDAALALLEEIKEDNIELALLITDERMPGMRGHELLKRVRAKYPGAYGILLTGYADLEAIGIAVNDAGLFCFMQKPWNRSDLALATRRALDLFRKDKEVLELRAQVEQINLAFVALLENPQIDKDPDTVDHVRRVAVHAALLARRTGLDDSTTHKILNYTPLHDIGKYGIPQNILGKPGRLEAAEFEIIKQHVGKGAHMLHTVDIDPVARNIILYHHEKWDGAGYLAGLSGEAIPREARIVALADVLDAMVSVRPYKPARPFDEAAAHIIGASGSHFDPEIVEAFKADLETHREVAEGNIPPDLDFVKRR